MTKWGACWPDWPGVHYVPLGILFARPEQETSRSEIIPSLAYFHHRSSADINFYCAGYGRYWPGELHTDGVSVQEVKGSLDDPWLFSPKAFAGLLSEIEQYTTWKYSGGVELLLLNATNEEGTPCFYLDYSRVINIDIPKARKYGVIEDTQHLFEDIFRVARDQGGALHVDKISDRLGGKSIFDAALDVLTGLVPRGIGRQIRGVKCFAVHDRSSRR